MNAVYPSLLWANATPFEVTAVGAALGDVPVTRPEVASMAVTPESDAP